MIFRGDRLDSYRSFEMERRIQRNLKRKHNNRKVYFIRYGNSNYYKIGFSTDIQRRLKDIQRCSPIEMTIFASTKANSKFERYLHKQYSKYNIRGEWFELKPDILNKAINFRYHKQKFRNWNK